MTKSTYEEPDEFCRRKNPPKFRKTVWLLVLRTLRLNFKNSQNTISPSIERRILISDVFKNVPSKSNIYKIQNSLLMNA